MINFHRKQLFAELLNAHLATLDPDMRLHLDGSGTQSLAAWFIGPKAENQELFSRLVQQGIDTHCQDRQNYLPGDPPYVTKNRRDDVYWRSIATLEQEYQKLLDNLQGSVPFFSYRYQAHMNWDLTIPGMLGYFVSMLYNQNNVAAEASPVTSQLEKLVGDDLCRMLGFTIPPTEASADIRPWGHITCDGSVANLEALWAARNLKYYAISVAEAIKQEDVLAPARDMWVPLPDGNKERLIGLDPWILMNLQVDVILGLPQRIADNYNIEIKDISAAIDPYLLQTLGAVVFNQRYAPEASTPVLIGTATKHYSWPKNAGILGIGKANFLDVHIDRDAHMDIEHLSTLLDTCLYKRQPVLMVVVVLGSTEESAVDPLAKVLALRNHYRTQGLEFAIHVDAAWGGYFASILREPADGASVEEQGTPALLMSDYVTAQYINIPLVESVTIDPHKAGYVPYPAGALCYRNSAMRNLVAFQAPEVYHGEIDPSTGIYGVEGSKPGAAAAGVYLSHRVIRPDRSGYGRILGQALFNSKRFFAAIITMAQANDPFIVVPVQQIPAERNGGSSKEIAAQLQFIYERITKPENDVLEKDEEAMELLKKLGSDQIIITYAFNFKDRNGVLNTDPNRTNEFNQAIFKRLSVYAVFKSLSLSPDKEKETKPPLIITTSEFDPLVYGDDFVRTFMRRLGLNDESLLTMKFISSTTMNPWLSATAKGNFIPTLITAFCEAILEEVKKFQ